MKKAKYEEAGYRNPIEISRDIVSVLKNANDIWEDREKVDATIQKRLDNFMAKAFVALRELEGLV